MTGAGAACPRFKREALHRYWLPVNPARATDVARG